MGRSSSVQVEEKENLTNKKFSKYSFEIFMVHHSSISSGCANLNQNPQTHFESPVPSQEYLPPLPGCKVATGWSQHRTLRDTVHWKPCCYVIIAGTFLHALLKTGALICPDRRAPRLFYEDRPGLAARSVA